MVANSWVMRVDAASKDKVEKWLDDEGATGYVLLIKPDAVQVDFLNIDDAFRFRMQFDEELLGQTA